jgi:PAS domain S-box-containing protein
MSAPFTSAPAATDATSSALRRLIDAIDAFERAGASVPIQLDGQPQDGQWVALAQGVQRLAHRVSEQVEALDHATRQRRDLLANVSHDLRTPLAAMQGYLELLLLRHANLEPKERHNYLEIAARQSERLARLVSDLFQLAELDGDDARPEREDFALGELIQDVIQKHASDAARRKIDTRLLATGAAALVHADIALVERLLTGLMENALRHTPAGGSVTLQAAYETAHAPGRVEVTVRDTGEGIASADLAGLFERYQSTERIAGSSITPHGGLGLAIARRIVQLHGGELRISSSPGVGTEVKFDLPLAARPNKRPGAVLGAITDPHSSASSDAVASVATASDRVAQLERKLSEKALALQRSETARQAAEADLRAIEQRYMLALRGSQDGLWEWDLMSDRVQLSPRWKSMLGFEPDEITDSKAGWLGQVHADDRTAFESALRAHLEAEVNEAQAFDRAVRLLHKDGSVRHVLSRGVVIRQENGVPFRVVGLDTDVTRVQRMQTVLDVLAEGTSDQHGADFLAALVRNFGRALDVDLAFIAECIDNPPTRVRTLACWRSERGDSANFDFELSGTPCEAVIQDGKTCFHRDDIERMFPRERGFAAYLGMPIIGSDGHVLGHLAFFDRAPRGDEMLVDSVYRIFLARAAAEMERLGKERRAG